MAGDVIYDAVLGAYTAKQVRRGSFGYNGQPVIGFQSGMLDPAELYGGAADPRANFSVEDVGGALAAISASTGLAVAAGTISVPFQKRSNRATFASGSSHFKATGANGLIIPLMAEAAQDGNASIDLQAIFQSTDGTDPVTLSSANALASQAYNKLWTLGPCSINGTAIGEVIRARINYGIEVLVERHNGMNFPDRVYIVRRRPSIDLTFNDFDTLDDFAAAFTEMTAAVVYFRRRLTATFDLDASTTHCKFSFADGIVSTETIEASDDQTGTATLRLFGEALTHNGASAIT
jgi:hypothetical protein